MSWGILILGESYFLCVGNIVSTTRYIVAVLRKTDGTKMIVQNEQLLMLVAVRRCFAARA